MDVILKESIDLINEIGAKQSTSEEIKALMQQGVTANVVKSMQTVDLSSTAYQGSANAAINTVNPSKCIVIRTTVQDITSGKAKADYTLESNKISYVSTSTVNGDLHFRFQIIELY